MIKTAFVLVVLLLSLAIPGNAHIVQDKDPDFGAIAKQCGSGITWITDPYVLGDMGPGADKTLPADRGALLEQAKKKAVETNRIICWYCFRIEGPHMYRAQLVDNYMMQSIWSDPDISDLVQRKFVAIKLCSDNKIKKLDAPDVVEPAIVFMSPDGTVLHKVERIRTFNADWVLSVMEGVLAKNAPFNGKGAKALEIEKKTPVDRLALAEELVKGSDLAAAQAIVSAPADGEDKGKADYLRALIARRHRKADEAIAALDKAKENAKDDLKGPIATERGLVQLRQRKLDDAFKSFEEAAKIKSPRQAEAKYFAAQIEYFRGHDALTLQRWVKLVREHIQTPWGWRAAANVAKSRDTTVEGAAAHGFEDPFWSGDEAYTAESTVWKRKDTDVDEIARRAMDYLLLSQRENGSWSDMRYAYWDGPQILPNVRMAVTSLASAALLEWRDLDPKRIDAALAKSEKYILEEANMARGKNEECYADAYRLQYWSRRWQISKEKRAIAQKGMIDAITGLGRSQKSTGSWAHEYPNAFCTAAVMNSLLRASQCKLEIPGKMVNMAAEMIKKSRGDDGGYKYDDGRGQASSPKDAMARMPVCEMGLFIGKLGTPETVEASLKNFWEHLSKLERIRKCDFHTDGELGGFFFFHGFFHTSEAIQLVVKETNRKEHQDKLLAHLLTMQELDGSFVDDHELGKSYGTAAALLSLKNALGGKMPTPTKK